MKIKATLSSDANSKSPQLLVMKVPKWGFQTKESIFTFDLSLIYLNPFPSKEIWSYILLTEPTDQTLFMRYEQLSRINSHYM